MAEFDLFGKVSEDTDSVTVYFQGEPVVVHKKDINFNVHKHEVKPVEMPMIASKPDTIVINGKKVAVKPAQMPMISSTPDTIVINGKKVVVKPAEMPKASPKPKTTYNVHSHITTPVELMRRGISTF